MIKYLGSKRTLVPALGAIASAVEARTAVDLFTGTTRVAQELKRRGLHVTAVDLATYSDVLARCFVETDADQVDVDELTAILAELQALPPRPGYVTRTFCEEARFFHPSNGARIDAIRDAIADRYADHPLHPVLLTSLLIAADKVDSTTGLQMAYLKQWAPRALRDLELRVPELIGETGRSILGDATVVVDDLEPVDLMYLDPPYNQHRYFANYHVWETLVRWDEPEAYGVARKRIDVRDDATRSVFNSKPAMPSALAGVLRRARAEVVVVSYNDESWLSADQVVGLLRDAGHEDVGVVSFDLKRYVGAQIGIHNPRGEKVGQVSHTRNTEHLFVAGPTAKVEAAVRAAVEATPAATTPDRVR